MLYFNQIIGARQESAAVKKEERYSQMELKAKKMKAGYLADKLSGLVSVFILYLTYWKWNVKRARASMIKHSGVVD